MIKRIVILQDEQLVVREIVRNMQRVAATAGASAAVAAQAGAAAVVAAPAAVATLPGPESFGQIDAEPEDADESPAPAAAGTNGSLSALAKAAAMKAERAAISETLTQVHWNRRKAAQILGVSYKTLLNKIKECAISRAS